MNMTKFISFQEVSKRGFGRANLLLSQEALTRKNFRNHDGSQKGEVSAVWQNSTER